MALPSVTTLGINDGHDASVALVRDGAVVAALQEERLRAVKHYTGVPELSIKEVFRISGVPPSEVDLIAIVSLNRVAGAMSADPPRKVKLFEKVSPLLHGHAFAKLYVRLLHKFRSIRELKKIFDQVGISSKETTFIEHHLAHASAAYRSSPWRYEDPCLILTADGAGDGLSSTVSLGEEGEMRRRASSTYYDSLGSILYSEVTRYLGMAPYDHEYKVMGLAPYGNPDRCIEKVRGIIRIDPERPLEFENTIGALNGSVQGEMRRLLAEERFDNIAAAVQKHFEGLMTEWVRNATEQEGVRRLACNGGQFLNVKANKLIRELEEVEDAFFYPAAGDDGTAVGAALEAYHRFCAREGIKPSKVSLTDLYYGPRYSDEGVEEVLRAKGLSGEAERCDDMDGQVGDLVAKGKIVARFSGRMEWGPRALGNRSILSDARDLKVVRRINTMIKQRDFWMPFAPTILDGRKDEYLIDAREAPYMILAFDSTEKRDDIIAAIHPQDFTCRPQTLNDWNEGYRRVLETFEKHTGAGGLLNTSFNLHGYPIVCTPEQAIWTFENSRLDGLALGNYLIKRRD